MALVEDESSRLNLRGEEEEEEDFYTDSDEDYEYDEDSEEEDEYYGSDVYNNFLDSPFYYYARKYGKMGYRYAASTAWVGLTTTIVVGFPLMYTCSKAYFEQMAMNNPQGQSPY